MKNKEFLNKFLIRDFLVFLGTSDKTGIAKRIQNGAVNIHCHPEFSSGSHEEQARCQGKENKESLIEMLKQVQHDRKVFQCHSLPKIPKPFLESGRSMVEMLGVLAVIGVLSAAGIAGYRYAMNLYQANQIANELNLVRSELQIKMANGNEQLILGELYDTGETIGDGHIAYNEAYGFTYDCGDSTGTPSDCRDEAAFYMETRDISEGVCRPLIRLVRNLSGLEAMYVNEVADGECGTETNDVLLVFGADVILDRRELPEDYCRKDEECASGKCRDNRCVECETNDDCEGSYVCETGNGICVECTGSQDCEATKPVCENYVCKPCPADTPVWNESLQLCEECPTDEEWNAETEVCEIKTCTSNADCDTTRNFCKITEYKTTGSCDSGNDNANYYSDLSGTCRSKGNLGTGHQITGVGMLYMSDTYMTWWAAKNWCEAHGKQMLDISGNKLGCYVSGTTTPFSTGTYGSVGSCCAAGQSCNYTQLNGISQSMKDLIAFFPDKWGWTVNNYNSCMPYHLAWNSGVTPRVWTWYHKWGSSYPICQN